MKYKCCIIQSQERKRYLRSVEVIQLLNSNDVSTIGSTSASKARKPPTINRTTNNAAHRDIIIRHTAYQHSSR